MKFECFTSLSGTEEEAVSGAVGLRTAKLVLGPEDEDGWPVAGLETEAGTFLSNPC